MNSSHPPRPDWCAPPSTPTDRPRARVLTLLAMLMPLPVLLASHPSAASPDAQAGAANWRQVENEVAPSARSGHAMVYDADRERIVLFGGGAIDWAGEGRPLGDTWEWNGQRWQRVDTTAGPPPRHGHAMVYESHRRRVLLFGGRDGDGRLLNDLWAYSDGNWQHLPTPGAPSPRAEPAMTYDHLREQTLLFGGRGGDDRPIVGTSLFDGRAWSERATITAPPSRYGHAMAYHPDDRYMLLYGGSDGGFPALNDAWRWDGSVWRRVEADEPDPPRARGVSLAWHGGLESFIIFGGRLVEPEARGFARTWRFDGEQWHRMDEPAAATPPDRSDAAMAYDTARSQLILFGGRGRDEHLADTWLLEVR